MRSRTISSEPKQLLRAEWSDQWDGLNLWTVWIYKLNISFLFPFFVFLRKEKYDWSQDVLFQLKTMILFVCLVWLVS